MFVHDFLRNHLLESVGIQETAKDVPSFESLQKTEWSPRFEQLMRNRLIMGAIRYDLLHNGKPKYGRMASAKKRLDLYAETGNTELLVDIANMCLIEFESPAHPKAHWKAEDDGIHLNDKER